MAKDQRVTKSLKRRARIIQRDKTARNFYKLMTTDIKTLKAVLK